MHRFKKIKMTILLGLTVLLSACSLPGLGTGPKGEQIVIAGGNSTERQILAQISKQMIEHYLPDVNVGLINNLGSSILIYQALKREDANISGLMYTGSSLIGELGYPANTNPAEAFDIVAEAYYYDRKMLWFPSYGFENTYAFMVTRSFAEQNNLKKVSDLQKLATTLRAGIDVGWMDRKGDGYEAFKEKYGFEFTNINPMEIGLVYNALQTGDMDIVLGYSTDGRIDAYDLVILEDDQDLFPPYDGSPAVSLKILEKYPQLEEIFLRLEGAIDTATMQKLNRTSDEFQIEPQKVAQDFLIENNYFEDKVTKPLDDRHPYVKFLKRGETT